MNPKEWFTRSARMEVPITQFNIRTVPQILLELFRKEMELILTEMLTRVVDIVMVRLAPIIQQRGLE